MLIDNHVHSEFSHDCREPMRAYIPVAAARGVDEICFTDHYDWMEASGPAWICDMKAVGEEIRRINDERPPVRIKMGVEMGVRLDKGVIEETVKNLSVLPLDHVIASVHLVGYEDPYFPDYFHGKSRQKGFALYVETLLECLKQTDFFTVAGHIDYPTKGCPYDDKRMRYEDAPDLLDELFKLLIERGKTLELNTSVLKKLNGQLQDIAIYKRFVELGGDFVSFGSDAHRKGDLAYRFDEVREFAKLAGFRYHASYEGMQALLHRL